MRLNKKKKKKKKKRKRERERERERKERILLSPCKILTGLLEWRVGGEDWEFADFLPYTTQRQQDYAALNSNNNTKNKINIYIYIYIYIYIQKMYT